MRAGCARCIRVSPLRQQARRQYRPPGLVRGASPRPGLDVLECRHPPGAAGSGHDGAAGHPAGAADGRLCGAVGAAGRRVPRGPHRRADDDAGGAAAGIHPPGRRPAGLRRGQPRRTRAAVSAPPDGPEAAAAGQIPPAAFRPGRGRSPCPSPHTAKNAGRMCPYPPSAPTAGRSWPRTPSAWPGAWITIPSGTGCAGTP